MNKFILYIFIALSVIFCQREEELKKEVHDFSINDFNHVIDTVKENHIDKDNLDTSKSYRGAAEYALLSLPTNLFIYPENYYENREKYESKDSVLEGEIFKLNPSDEFLIFEPDYSSLKDKEEDKEVKKNDKTASEEIKEIVEREKKKKQALNQEWDKIDFKEKDFKRVIAFIEQNLEKYKKLPDSEKKEDFSEEEKDYLENFSINNVLLASVNGYLSSLDPHSNVFKKQEWEESMRQIENNSFEGIGAYLTGGGERDVVIANPLEGSPALRAGIKAGDAIWAVDSKTVRGWSVIRVRDKIRGKKGTTVVLSVKRVGQEKTIDIPVIRDKIIIKNITKKLLNYKPHIGYIKLTGFIKSENESVEEEIPRALETLKKQALEQNIELKGLIFDLRRNSGGYLDLAIDVADMFIPKGLIVSTKTPYGSPRESFAEKKDITNLPLAVLIDAGSASASEIVASAIQHHGRGLILGERSFGKGTVQRLMELDSNSNYMVKLTQARYYSPSGKTIQVAGVYPDINLSDEEDGSFPFKYVYREEDMWNHLPNNSYPKVEGKKHFDIEKLKSWVKKNGKTKQYINEHKKDAIKPDYQLIRAADYLDALINL